MTASPPVCRVPALPAEPAPEGAWDAPPWRGIEPLALAHHMGARPAHFPRAQVRVAYQPTALCVLFRVEDRWVRAVARGLHAPVCRDSCVEFFFTPGADVSAGYFNLELNCGGAMLFHFQKVPRKDSVPLPAAACAQVGVFHSMPSRVEPEAVEPVTWTVQARVPLAILRPFTAVDVPAPGVIWRGNFYKCADATSHPHWLTWAPVRRPQPDFHVPECFGTLAFA